MVASPHLRTVCCLALLLGLCAPLARLHAQDDADAVPGLTKALQDDNALVRKRAALALERLGPKAKAAAPALAKALKDDDADVRAAAAAALEKIDAPRSLAVLLRRVHDKEVEGKRRAEACKELGEHFGHEPAAVRALEAALTDPVIKLDAARALEMIDTRAKHKAAVGGRHGTRVAILNLTYVITNYKKWKEVTEELRGEYNKYGAQVQALNAQMENLKKQLAATTDPDEKDKLETQAKKLQQQMQEVADEAKKVLGKKESAEMVVFYKEITEAAASYARDNDIDLVLHYNEATSDANSAANVQRKMVAGPTTPLYVKSGDLDISEVVLERLNARYASATPRTSEK